MLTKLRNRIARLVPFMKWLASDPAKAQERLEAEVKETETEIRNEIKKL